MDDTGPKRANLKGWCFIFLSKRIMGDFVPRHLLMLLFLVCYIHFLRKVSCSSDRGAFSHPGNMQFVYIWKRFTGEKTNQYNLSPVLVGVHDEPPVETEMELPHHP